MVIYPDDGSNSELVNDIKENYSTGWIRIYRSIKNHWVWQDSFYFKLWIDFIMRANHKTNKSLIEGNFVNIIRGSFITSLKKLAKENGVSISKIRHFLSLLEKDSMITLKTTHKYTQITINNYDTYQDLRHAEGTLKETKKKPKSTLKETNNNDNNDNNDKKLNPGGYFMHNGIKKIKSDYFFDLLPLNSSQIFKDAWTEWIDFRREIKHKITKSTAKKQLDFLSKHNFPEKIIEQSIKNGWQGLFELKNEDKSNGRNTNESAGSVKSRLDYRFDADKSAKRLEELKELFGEGDQRS